MPTNFNTLVEYEFERIFKLCIKSLGYDTIKNMFQMNNVHNMFKHKLMSRSISYIVKYKKKYKGYSNKKHISNIVKKQVPLLTLIDYDIDINKLYNTTYVHLMMQEVYKCNMSNIHNYFISHKYCPVSVNNCTDIINHMICLVVAYLILKDVCLNTYRNLRNRFKYIIINILSIINNKPGVIFYITHFNRSLRNPEDNIYKYKYGLPQLGKMLLANVAFNRSYELYINLKSINLEPLHTDDVCICCFNLFYEPLTIQCGHTICKTCYGKLQQLKCPHCRFKINTTPSINISYKSLLIRTYPQHYKFNELKLDTQDIPSWIKELIKPL